MMKKRHERTTKTGGFLPDPPATEAGGEVGAKIDVLTDPKPTGYAQSHQSKIAGDVYMGFLGSVGTDERCPKCGNKFKLIAAGKGFICPQDLTTPTRYWISAKALGIFNKLYSDRQGTVFSDYAAAHNQWAAMNTAYMEAKRTDKGRKWTPEDWIAAKVSEQQYSRKVEQFLASKKTFYDRRKLSKGHWNNLNRHTAFSVEYFKSQDIRTITEGEIEAFYLHCLDLKDEKQEPYSDAYIKHIMDALRSVLLKYRGQTDTPDFPRHTVDPKREKQWLGIERQMSVEPHVSAKVRLAIMILQITGMRQGEVRALQVNDMIDGALKVWKAFSDHKDAAGNKIVKLARKSGGEVTYPIPLYLWNELQKHVEGKQSDDFIFTHEDGSPFGQNCMPRAWKKACKDAGVKHIPLQQASRHSMASQIMSNAKKKAIEEIQAKLGHHNKQTQKAYIVE